MSPNGFTHPGSHHAYRSSDHSFHRHLQRHTYRMRDVSGLWTRLRHGFPSACLISLVQSVSCVYSSPAQHPHIARTSPTHRPHIARCRKPRDLRMMHTENSGPANPLPSSDALRRSNVFLQRAMCGRCAGDVRAMAGDGNNHIRHPPRNAGGKYN